MTLTTDERAAMRARVERASDGPWETVFGEERGDLGSLISRYCEGVRAKGRRWVIRFDDYYGTDQSADADFIAHARTDIPRLLDALEERDAEVERLREAGKSVLDNLRRVYLDSHMLKSLPIETSDPLHATIEILTRGYEPDGGEDEALLESLWALSFLTSEAR